ncbi:MAG: histidine kinase [Bacteroidales bacterium]|nr:histidine kinase [Bacteroidales bacterium]
MSGLHVKANIFLLVILFGINNLLISQEQPDTTEINRQTRTASLNSRRNPDLSIMVARQALASSRNINYKLGMADAYLALGNAWLAKYNPGDSALSNCLKALDLYSQLEDDMGMGRSYYALAYIYSFKSNLRESERYSLLCLEYFEKAGFKQGIISAYHVLSYLARQEKDLEKARDYIEKAIEAAGSINDTVLLADVTNTLGTIYSEMALFSQAIDSYFKALHLWEMKGDSSGMSIAYGSIGLAYYYQEDYNRALEFFKRHLVLSEKRKDLWELSKVCNNIALIYNSRSIFDSALIYQRRSLALNKQMNTVSGEASTSHNLASTFLYLHQFDSAYWYINRAMTLASKASIQVPPDYYVTLGNILRWRGRYQQASENALRAYSLAREKDMPHILLTASLLLSEIYAKTGHEDLAYRYLKEYTQLSDSISNDKFLKQVTRMEIQYDFDKKQKEAEFARMEERILNENKLRQQKQYVNGLLILIVLLSLISFLYIRHNRLRAQFTRIDLEQRLLRAQMNPHFIFNSLCAVQDFILAGKPQKANTFLTKIARLMRNILENSREEFIPLEKEIETVKLYLDIQQLRFENEFDYNISLDGTIDPENLSIPPMLTQPCVENSIEHGLLPLKEKGHLKVTFSISNGLMKLEVTDNGIGRKEATEKAAEKGARRSVSTKVTAERLENFRKTLRKKSISYEIIDLYDNDRAAGTKVVMMLPYKKIYA